MVILNADWKISWYTPYICVYLALHYWLSVHVTINEKNFFKLMQKTIFYQTVWSLYNSNLQSKHTYPLTQHSVHHRTIVVVQFCSNFWPLLLPVNHEGIGRLLHIRPIILLLLVSTLLPSLGIRKKKTYSEQAHVKLSERKGDNKARRITWDAKNILLILIISLEHLFICSTYI